MKRSKIAILGATSHIAKGLIYNFLRNRGGILHLYARSSEKTRDFLSTIGNVSDSDCVIHEGFDDVINFSYDVIINCVGVGTMNKPHSNYADYFTVNEEYDNLAIHYLREYNSHTLYICFSSGAVYGRNFTAPVEENSLNCIKVNHVTKEDYYTIVRLNSEAKHRAFTNLRIIDLRIFSYFSRFINLTDGYFITDVINCVLNKRVFVTNSTNIIRDYIHPQDLFSMVIKCIVSGKINAAFDMTSVKPVEKKEIVDYFVAEYGLKCKIGQPSGHANPTGMKNIYYSKHNNATGIGYKPIFNSMDAIKDESRYIITKLNKIKKD